ncbi:hypothetical protein J6590_027565 [Homalodisca vitripennis]|nr:hypothetical protein J6590_027565 [Homalodisca vitripennis]
MCYYATIYRHIIVHSWFINLCILGLAIWLLGLWDTSSAERNSPEHLRKVLACYRSKDELRLSECGELDPSALLGMFNLRVRDQTRSSDLFCGLSCSTKYDTKSIIPRLYRLGSMATEDY